MRAISTAFRRELEDNSTLIPRATLTLASGDVVELDGGDFFSFAVEQSTSSDGSFDIGAAIIGKLECELNNVDGKFDACDFTGATMTAWVGKRVSDSFIEYVRLGHFEVDQPDSYSGTIKLSALDNMSKFEGAASSLTLPATVQEVAEQVCGRCGVVLATSQIPNGSHTITAANLASTDTYLSVIGWLAQIACCFARCNASGELELGWYDTKVWELEDWVDGGRFDEGSSSYVTGGSADGGNFSDYSSGDTVNGGTFDHYGDLARVHGVGSLTVFTDDVVVTGVQVTAQSEQVESGTGRDGETALYGSNGYVLSLTGNKLVPYGSASTVARLIGARCVGMRFRPFSASVMADPSIECGDAVVVTDRRGNEYRSYCTYAKLAANSSETLKCSAKSASRNSAPSASAATKAFVEARNEMKRELSSRDLAIKDITQKLSESSGLYSTKQRQTDGSYVYYLHDKPDLKSSKIVYKITAEAMAISTDGGESFSAALSADGTAVLDRIYAIGINADHITAGTINGDRIKGGTIEGSIYRYGSDTEYMKISNSKLFTTNGETCTIITPNGVQVGKKKQNYESVADGLGNATFISESGLIVSCKKSPIFPQFTANGWISIGLQDIEGVGIESPCLYKNTDTGETKFVVVSSNTSDFHFVYSSSNPYLEFQTPTGTFGITAFRSDKRLKESIVDSSVKAIEIIRSIRHRAFRWRDVVDGLGEKHKGSRVECGYVAQEMQEIDDSFAFTVAEGTPNERMQISEQNLLPYITKAIQELDTRLSVVEKAAGIDNEQGV